MRHTQGLDQSNKSHLRSPCKAKTNFEYVKHSNTRCRPFLFDSSWGLDQLSVSVVVEVFAVKAADRGYWTRYGDISPSEFKAGEQ